MTFIPHFIQDLPFIRGIIDLYRKVFVVGSRAGRRITSPGAKFTLPTDI